MDNMFTELSQASGGMNLPLFETRRALIIVNMQNDSFYVNGDLYITKNRDFVPHLKEMIPYFRKHGDIVWVNTTVAAASGYSPNLAKAKEEAAAAAEKDRKERSKREQQVRIEEAANRAGPSSIRPDSSPDADKQTYYASSKAQGIMTRASAGTRAEKRAVDAQVFDDKDNVLEKQLSKRRKGQQSRFYIAGTRGADICDDLVGCVDESLDLIVTKHHYSAFDETSLLMALRQRLVTEVYLCGCLTNVSIYSTAADAVQHGLQVTVVEDCLGYRNEDKHEEAMRQMADIMGVHGIDSEEIIEEAGGRPIPDAKTPGITLDDLSLSSPRITANEIDRPQTQLEMSVESLGAPKMGILSTARSDQGSDAAAPPVAEEPRIEQEARHTALQDVSRKTVDSVSRAKQNRNVLNAPKSQTLGPNDSIGSSDSKILLNVVSSPTIDTAFERMKEEVAWQTMLHRSGQVPRLVAVQGEVGRSGEIPIYRHPADESPPLLPFTPMVQEIRKEIESVLSQSFNHALIQLYRDGIDNISEHSDKTLDIVHGSAIVNVSIGAERIMTLRTKKPKHTQGADSPRLRYSQRVRMPHNSLFVLGPRTNREWLHGVRADKRPDRERTEGERAFGGERISITFRQIGTFMDRKKDKIWGAGAKAKSKDGANKISTQDSAQMEAMINAFGQENHNADFDWDAGYGQGFDVVNLINEKAKLTLCSDSVANIRVQLALCEKAISYTALEQETSQEPCSENPNTRFQPWMHGLSNSDNPTFQDVDEKASKTEGDLGILFYLEMNYPFPTASGDQVSLITAKPARPSAQMYTQIGQSNELLFLWRELRDSLSQPGGGEPTPTNRFRLERPITPNSMLHDEFHAALKKWEDYAETDEYIAGSEWGIVDCAFWPVLHHLVEGSGEVNLERYPCLMGYYERGRGRECVRAVLAQGS